MSGISRRTFLRSSAAAATLASVPAARAGASEKIGVGVIGCRNRGWQLAGDFAASGRFDVLALAECDDAMYAEAIKALAGKDAFPKPPRHEKDFRRLLDDSSIDAILIATPDHWHALMAIMALDAGKHVYLEKPASHTIEDGKAMVAAAKRHPELVVAMGTQQRSGPHFKEAKALIDSGELGRIAHARAWFVSERHRVNIVPDSDPPATLDYEMWIGPARYRPYNAEKLHYNWHFMKDYGTGDAGNWGGHWLDVVRWYADLDLPTAASAMGGTYVVRDGKEWPDTQTTLFEFPDLTVAWEMRHWSSFGPNRKSNGAELCGEKGSLVIDRGGWTFYPDGGKPQSHPGSELMKPHVQNFAECIAGTATPAAGIEDGHKTAVLCHLANISTVVNRRLAFSPDSQSIRDDREAQAMEGHPYRDPWTLPA